MAEVDSEGFPLLPKGLYWRITTDLWGFGMIQIRTERRWGRGALVEEHRWWPDQVVTVRDMAAECWQKWQKRLGTKAARDAIKRGRHGHR